MNGVDFAGDAPAGRTKRDGLQEQLQLPISKRPPVDRLLPRHWAYLLVMYSLGAMIIAGGINFAIAYGMYAHTGKPIQLWNINNNTQAGDFGVTTIIECIVCWIISAMLVCQDVRQGAYGAAPLLPSWPPPPSGGAGVRLLRWYVNVEGMDLLGPRISLLRRVKRLIGSALRGFLICIPTFFIWWPIGVGIMAGIGTDQPNHEYNFKHKWTPQVAKLIYGGTMALLVNPIIAYLALLAKGAEHQLAVAHGSKGKDVELGSSSTPLQPQQMAVQAGGNGQRVTEI